MVTQIPDPPTQTEENEIPVTRTNDVISQEAPASSSPRLEERQEKGGGEGEDEGGGSAPDHAPQPNHQPNGWNDHGSSKTLPPNVNGRTPPSRRRPPPQAVLEGGGAPRDAQQENVVLRRGFVPRTAPERVAQRKSSMAQLQQWVNQRRGVASQEDLNR